MNGGVLNSNIAPGYLFYLGRNGNGHLILNGGSINNQGTLYIGTFASSSGVLDIHGGTMTGTRAAIGYQGTGTLTMTGGVLTLPSGTFLGVTAGGHGIANLNGGVLATSVVENDPATGTASLSFNGGTLRATEDNDDFIILPGTIAVGSGGATIDSNGYTIGIAPTFSGDSSSSLTKTGAGSLNLLTANNTFFGNIIVDQGNLNLPQPDAIATARTVYIQTGGSLNTQDNDQILPQLSGAANGNVNSVNGILTLENPSGGDSLYAGNITSNEAVYKTGAGAITLSGQLQWAGDTYLQEGNLILDGSAGAGQLTSNVIGQDGTQLSLHNGAVLTGWVDPTNVDIDTSSRWNMTANSQVNNIVLSNNGAVAFVPPLADDFKTLTVLGNLQGNNGLVVLNTRLGDDNSLTDKLAVEGNTAGTTRVQVNNAGGLGYQTMDGIEIITVAGQSNGEFVKDGRIVAGAYDYSLARGLNGNANNWYLTSRITPVDPEDPVDPSDPYDPKDPVLERPEPGAYTANLTAANNMFVTSLHDRLGETQYIDALTGERKVTSMWMRNEGGHNRSRDDHDQLRTQANRYVLQLGGDIAQWTHNGQGRFHLGAMVGYGHTHSNTVSRMSGYDAKGSVNGYNIGAYGTWYANQADKSGLYVDGWLQYSWFNNSVNGQGLAGEDYKSKGMTASLESGYAFKLGENSDKTINYFIQPNGQLTWMGVKADDHRETNGTLVKGEGDGNLQARLGVKTFMDIHHSVDQAVQPYVEANWIHNSKDFGTNMNGISVKQDGALNIAELKVGVEGQVNKQVNLWGNVGQQVGNKGYSDTAVMIGGKYNF
ncbi:type V secretion protein A [Serratia sp. S1B]|nr:type V secretion protein A [Serratia sp. S1B]